MKRKIAAKLTAALSTALTASMCAMPSFADDAAASGSGKTAMTGNPILTLVIPLGAMFVILYFMAIRPQKKK